MIIRVRARRDLVCRQAVELISAYLDGALAPRDVRRLERHLAACVHCAEYLEQVRVTIAVSGRLDADRLDDDVAEAITEVYRQWREG